MTTTDRNKSVIVNSSPPAKKTTHMTHINRVCYMYTYQRC